MRTFAGLLTVLLLAGCASYTPGDVSNQLAPESNGTIWFASSDAYDLVSFASAPAITVEGSLSFPSQFNGGAVIMSHGSGGIGQFHHRWKSIFHEMGLAVFLLDHFRPRKTINVLHSQVRVTEQQMAFDILQAFALLQTHPRINKKRIFHAGWSKGASAGLVASFEKVKDLVLPDAKGNGLAGFIEFYPWCGIRAKLKAASPVLILHGTDDDYTPLAFCETMAADMRAAGSNIRIERFEGSVHGFDNWTAERSRQNFITVRKDTDDCTLEISPTSLRIASVSGMYTVDTYENRKVFLTNCAARGVWLGGSPQYKMKTLEILETFLLK